MGGRGEAPRQACRELRRATVEPCKKRTGRIENAAAVAAAVAAATAAATTTAAMLLRLLLLLLLSYDYD